jgi:hypothetical protein
MKLLIIPALLILAASPCLARGHSSGGSHSSSSSRSHSSYRSPGEHYTRTYTTRRGTTVRGHYDTNPDGHFGNNYSTKGNINPHTGQEGTKVTPPRGEAQ